MAYYGIQPTFGAKLLDGAARHRRQFLDVGVRLVEIIMAVTSNTTGKLRGFVVFHVKFESEFMGP